MVWNNDIRAYRVADIIGLWSKTRSSFLGQDSPPLPTGDLAYRILLHTKDLKDSELKEFASIPRVSLWVGPDCHVMCYPLKNNTMLNIVLLVPDNLPEAVAKAPGDLEEMHEIFKSWDPR
jgi:salicylate hydroxylase